MESGRSNLAGYVFETRIRIRLQPDSQNFTRDLTALDRALLSSTLSLTFVASEWFYTPGTHQGRIKLFLAALGTPSSASVFL
jgi:hypothetical protein